MQTSIRGLSPQAGGFRRRPNRPSSVGRGSRRSLTHRPLGRLPCVTASVYQAPAVPYHTPIRGSLSTPNITALSSGEQYNTKQTLAIHPVVPVLAQFPHVGYSTTTPQTVSHRPYRKGLSLPHTPTTSQGTPLRNHFSFVTNHAFPQYFLFAPSFISRILKREVTPKSAKDARLPKVIMSPCRNSTFVCVPYSTTKGSS